MKIQGRIEFMLSHFDSVLFPRKMMTKKSNYQFTINSKEQLLQECLSSNLIDCRINAYPEQINPGRLTNQTPNFIFIDLDLSSFNKYKNPKSMLDKSLMNTLDKISELLYPKRSQHRQHTLLSHDINKTEEKQPFVDNEDIALDEQQQPSNSPKTQAPILNDNRGNVIE